MIEPKTPLPWVRVTHTAPATIEIMGPNEEHAAFCSRWENAAYIVHAANTLPALRKRVAELESFVRDMSFEHSVICTIREFGQACDCGTDERYARRAALLEARNDE